MLFHRRLDHEYPTIVRGHDCYLVDQDGKAYFDAAGGAAVAILGHSVRDLMQGAVDRVDWSYLHGAQFTSEDLETYGRRLVELMPDDLTRVLLVSSGSEAVETAIKLVYQYSSTLPGGSHDKRKVLATDPGYHGATGLALAVTGKAMHRRAFRGLLREHPFVRAPDAYRRPEGQSLDAHAEACADELERVILREGPESCLAFLVEPVIGSGMGVGVSPPGYLRRVREICDRYDVALIFDEVMCGFGRCGAWSAAELWDVEPDVLIQGKGLAAGLLPLSAVYASRTIVEGIRANSGNFMHGFTFTNHALAASVGNLVLDQLQQHDLLANVRRQGEYLRRRLAELTTFSWIDDVRGLGLLNGFEMVADKAERRSFARSRHVAERFLQRALQHGGNFYFAIGYLPSGDGDAILMMPPYNL
ncbi:MAG: aminotransferase class III-fold pyridoxal phosphate-dependent enzyme, partial [Deltaproteobacteria bacterium]|nr:aminotransferase class III-fold pyridoxal phosphate-dependent enzyme [Deltaproteobacteria bacterium]